MRIVALAAVRLERVVVVAAAERVAAEAREYDVRCGGLVRVLRERGGRGGRAPPRTVTRGGGAREREIDRRERRRGRRRGVGVIVRAVDAAVARDDDLRERVGKRGLGNLAVALVPVRVRAAVRAARETRRRRPRPRTRKRGGGGGGATTAAADRGCGLTASPEQERGRAARRGGGDTLGRRRAIAHGDGRRARTR